MTTQSFTLTDRLNSVRATVAGYTRWISCSGVMIKPLVRFSFTDTFLPFPRLAQTAGSVSSSAANSETMRTLISLSAELIIMILSLLDGKSLSNCTAVRVPRIVRYIARSWGAQTCKTLHDIVSGTLELQYAIELAVAGCEDGSSDLSVAERYDRLLAHQEAWEKLDWTSEYDIPARNGGQVDINDSVLAENEDSHTLVFHRLPSQLRGVEASEWTFRVDPPIRDFAIDPSQDLLVVIEQQQTR